MRYDTPGTYTLDYTATDACGNTTTETRTIYVEGFNTTLFTDGTLIINESTLDRDANITAHGAVVEEYPPLDADNTYEFENANDQPWLIKRQQITTVEFGSAVTPTSMAYWFQDCKNLASIDFTNFDGSAVTTIRAEFSQTAITTIALPAMPNLTNLQYTFNRCYSLTDIDFSNVGATGIENMQDTFQSCYSLVAVSLVGLAGTIDKCERTFANTNNDGMGDMRIQTIYADNNLKFWQATSSTNMFRSCTSLVGGNGTVFRSDVTNKDYARIDNLPDEPGYFTRG